MRLAPLFLNIVPLAFSNPTSPPCFKPNSTHHPVELVPRLAPLPLSDHHVRHCDPNYYTWQPFDTPTPPLIWDCLVLLDNIEVGGSWRTDQSGFRQILDYESCRFGVQQHSATIIIFKIGDDDVRDLVLGAIQRYRTSDWRVAAQGYIMCEGDSSASKQNSVYWQLY
ncbi:putative necrosis-inducing factor-domain-containing protein [Lasiosphaeria hispida]|uniref:Necrosis-inducing factor-domain-containing protein n=1 Tax=Lasiosphaeria hispida TaxID=260671 RepID=A0AAJ0HSD8_9PEZI|nr:putative necrosis-inducing factor-domain-containing protein [Lasiosphaeria hispida]